MKKNAVALFLFLTYCISALAYEWDGTPIPVQPESGKRWQLQSISDDFSYYSSYGNRPNQFSQRWKDSFINPWTGPSLTEWNPGHVWSNGDLMAVQAHQKAGSNKIYMGCMSSRQAFTYPLFVEAKVKLASLMASNNVWMLSADSTEEIDVMETYPSDRSGQEWFDQRIHLSHHVFIRQPFQDYQPRDEEGVAGTWYWEDSNDSWRDGFVRVGMYWRDPWHLEYYINGKWVRTLDKMSYSYLDEFGQKVSHARNFNIIDKYNYTNGTGLSKPMHLIINMEQQSWRTDLGHIPSAEELEDSNNKNIMWVDWIRVYKAI